MPRRRESWRPIGCMRKALTIEKQEETGMRLQVLSPGQMIYDLAKSLQEGHGVSKSLYDEAVQVLTERGIVEVIGLCGYYTMVSMTLNTFEFGLPEGEVSDLA